MKKTKLFIFILIVISTLLSSTLFLVVADNTANDFTVQGNVVISDDEITINNGKIITKEEYQGFIMYVHMKATENSTITIKYNDYSLTFNKSNVSGENLTITKNTFDFSALTDACYLRMEVLGKKLTVGIRSNGSENQLYIPVVMADLVDFPAKSSVEIGSIDGEINVKSFKVHTLGSSLQIETEDYSKENEDKYNKNHVKPELNSGNNKVWLVILIVGTAVLVIAGVVTTLIIIRKKGANNK